MYGCGHSVAPMASQVSLGKTASQIVSGDETVDTDVEMTDPGGGELDRYRRGESATPMNTDGTVFPLGGRVLPGPAQTNRPEVMILGRGGRPGCGGILDQSSLRQPRQDVPQASGVFALGQFEQRAEVAPTVQVLQDVHHAGRQVGCHDSMSRIQTDLELVPSAFEYAEPGQQAGALRQRCFLYSGSHGVQIAREAPSLHPHHR